MAPNPIAEIRSEFSKKLNSPFPQQEKTNTRITFSFNFTAVEFAGVSPVQMEAAIRWRKKEGNIEFFLSRQDLLFEPWDARSMYEFFIDLTDVLTPHLVQYVPEWGNLLSGMNPARCNRDAVWLMPMYHGTIDCGEYIEDEVAELTLQHLHAGADSLVLSQGVFKALAYGNHELDLCSEVSKMARLRTTKK